MGLLAALLGVQRGLDVFVFDRLTEGPRPGLARALGATYLTGSLDALPSPPDIVMECTGSGAVVLDVLRRTARGGIVCLAGLSSGGHARPVDFGLIERMLVLENDVVFGSVNANRRHYLAAADALARADRQWLASLITRRLPLDRWREAIQPDARQQAKTILDFTL